jgi:Domain of unknown function (DUF4376)
MRLVFSNGLGLVDNGSTQWPINVFPSFSFGGTGCFFNDQEGHYWIYSNGGRAEMTSDQQVEVSNWIKAQTPPGDTRTLAQAQAEAYSRIKAQRDAREMAPFTWNGHLFDADSDSQRRISGGVQLATIAVSQGQGAAFSITWTLADNSTLVLSATDMVAVGEALASQVEALWNSYRASKAQVDAATTNAIADGVNLP